MTRSALREVSAQFSLDMYDEATVTRLALHVKNLIARSRLDQSLSTPLGISFRATHPFIHELALMVARHIEDFAGIEIGRVGSTLSRSDGLSRKQPVPRW